MPDADIETQKEKDARIRAAFGAWENRKTHTMDGDGKRIKTPREEIDALWLAMWEAADFSWAGLADVSGRNPAIELKQFTAPEGFPIGGEITLQDYWRWSLGVPEFETDNRLLTDDELKQAGLLVARDGNLWHVLHLPAYSAVDHAPLQALLTARLKHAPGFQGYGPEGRVLLTGARAQALDRTLRGFGTASGEAEPPTIHILGGAHAVW